MPTFKNLRAWFSLEEAAQQLSFSTGEIASTADILRLCLDGHLTLSIRFRSTASVRPGFRLPSEEVTVVIENTVDMPELNPVNSRPCTGESVTVPGYTAGTAGHVMVSSEGCESDIGLIIEKNVVKVEGVLDLLLFSDGRHIVENQYDQFTGGAVVERDFVKGIYLEGDDGIIYQLQERFDEKVVNARHEAIALRLREEAEDSNMPSYEAWKYASRFDDYLQCYDHMWKKTATMQNYMPAGRLPKGAEFVIRAPAVNAMTANVFASPRAIADSTPIKPAYASSQANTSSISDDAYQTSSTRPEPTWTAERCTEAESVAVTTKAADSELTKREKQVLSILAAAGALGYPALRIPTGGKGKIHAECKRTTPDLFGGGPDPFLEAWQVAVTTNRVRMKEHAKFSPKAK